MSLKRIRGPFIHLQRTYPGQGDGESDVYSGYTGCEIGINCKAQQGIIHTHTCMHAHTNLHGQFITANPHTFLFLEVRRKLENLVEIHVDNIRNTTQTVTRTQDQTRDHGAVSCHVSKSCILRTQSRVTCNQVKTSSAA